MTEAEKQAIDNFKFFNEGDYITREMEENKDVVLNLIEKQQKEIKEAYWKGYTARDTEAQSICKSCEYKAEINALQMEHNHDVKMIDEVKGEAVKLYKEIETLKRDFEIVDHECNRLEQENIKKDKQIEQYINMLATNDMLHVLECEKKDKIIDEMAEYIDEITEEIAREKGVEDFEFCDNKCTDKDEYIECKQCIKEYFKNKAKESK